MNRLRKLILLVICLGICAGCGADGPFSYVPVDGTLTYEDGTPLPSGGIQLKFISLEAPIIEGAKARPAIAHVDQRGRFDRATSYKYGDGLVPGKHKVAVLHAEDSGGKLLIPKEYSSPTKTPVVVDTGILPIEIKVPKP